MYCVNFPISIIDIVLKIAGSNFFMICISCIVRGRSDGGSAIMERVME